MNDHDLDTTSANTTNELHGFGDLSLGELERRARGGREALPLREWIALAEAWRIALALRESRGNRSAAARNLGIGRRTLYSKIEKLGLEPTWAVPRRSNGFTPRALSGHEPRP
jgi:DNA-binding NtrC family response regulator